MIHEYPTLVSATSAGPEFSILHIRFSLSSTLLLAEDGNDYAASSHVPKIRCRRSTGGMCGAFRLAVPASRLQSRPGAQRGRSGRRSLRSQWLWCATATTRANDDLCSAYGQSKFRLIRAPLLPGEKPCAVTRSKCAFEGVDLRTLSFYW